MEKPSEYFRGMKACHDGKPHLINQHPDWDQGFSDQYHLEQSITGQQLEREREHSNKAIQNSERA